jgi:hypothetical protein
MTISRSTARTMLDRCAAIDWRKPAHDAGRITAAYQRWQAALDLTRPIRLIADPIEAQTLAHGNREAAAQRISDVWPNPVGSPMIRSVWLTSPTASLPVQEPEWDIAMVWACAFSFAFPMWSSEEQQRTEVANDLSKAFAAVHHDAVHRPGFLEAMALLNTPLFGLFDPPSRFVSIVADALAAAGQERAWQHLMSWNNREIFAGLLNINISARLPPHQSDVIDALISVAEPMIDACESGAFAHVFAGGELIVLTSPPIWTDGRRLHRADGPAIAWPDTKVYAWKGCIVPERFILERERMTPDDIRAVSDEQARRALIDVYACTHGYLRCMRDFGGVMVQEDDAGRLWCINPFRKALAREPGDIKIVEVVNGTVDADGVRKTYWLSVPPEMQTATQAVAWTYGMTPEHYGALVVRT